MWVKGAPTRSTVLPAVILGHYETLTSDYENVKTCSSYIDAAYRFFRTRCEDELISRRGLAGDKNKKKRRHEHIVRVRMFFMYCFSYM